MQSFRKIYNRMLTAHQESDRKSLVSSITSSDRLVAVRGARGIGKTIFLLTYAVRNITARTDQIQYVTMNYLYFAGHSLYDFARKFYQDEGGRILLVDQIYKYAKWRDDLYRIYMDMPNLRVIFSTSSVVTEEEMGPELKGRVRIINLQGFSFRQYLNIKYGLHLKAYSLKDLMERHEEIAAEVMNQVKPKEDFELYLTEGYYPPVEDNPLSSAKLTKNINMMLEVDVVYVHQVDISYLPKMRELLFQICTQDKPTANVTRFARSIGASRATIANYLKYLDDAELIRTVYKEGNEYPKKPDQIFPNDTNIAGVMYPHRQSTCMRLKTFLLSQFENAGYRVNVPDKPGADFIVDGEHLFACVDGKTSRFRSEVTYTFSNLLVGHDNCLPIWLFGFLY